MTRTNRYLFVCLFALLQCLLPLLHAHADEDAAHMSGHGLHLDEAEVHELMSHLFVEAHHSPAITVDAALAARECRLPILAAHELTPSVDQPLVLSSRLAWSAGLETPPIEVNTGYSYPSAERPLIPYPGAPPRA